MQTAGKIRIQSKEPRLSFSLAEVWRGIRSDGLHDAQGPFEELINISRPRGKNSWSRVADADPTSAAASVRTQRFQQAALHGNTRAPVKTKLCLEQTHMQQAHADTTRASVHSTHLSLHKHILLTNKTVS